MTDYGTEVFDTNGVCVAQSRNLRGMRDYARKSPVVHVRAYRFPALPERGVMIVTYANGATCKAGFASYPIMIDWIRNRRTWRSAEFDIAENVGYLTKPGIIAGA